MKTTHLLGLISACLVGGAALGEAQVILDTTAGSHTYSQNFNTLPSTGNPAWTDNSTLSGWYGTPATTSTFAGLIVATTGANGNFLGSFGSSSATDRALGANPGGANKAWGVRLQNTGTSDITIDSLSFYGEQWRTGGSTTAQTVTFSYQVSATPIVNLSSGSYVSLTGLNFTGPNTSSTNTNIDGNAAGNRVSTSQSSLGIVLAAGSEIMLKWTYLDGAGNDANLAIDDLQIGYSTAAVPEPSTMGLLLVSAAGLFRIIRRRRV